VTLEPRTNLKNHLQIFRQYSKRRRSHRSHGRNNETICSRDRSITTTPTLTNFLMPYHTTFSTNLLKLYVDHGLEVSNVTLFVQFRGDRVFAHLPEIVARARLEAGLAKNPDGTRDFAKVLVGEMMKLVGKRCVNLYLLLIFNFN
jgi:hypothetical protein